MPFVVGAELGPGRRDMPFGGGDSAGNLKIGHPTGGTNRVVYRLVPWVTGTLWDVWIETRARTGPACSPTLADTDAAESSSYSGGNPNNWLWEVRFHPVLASGNYDPTVDLVPARQFNPYFQRRQTSFEYSGVLTASALKIPAGDAGLAVTAGTMIAMTVAPVNADPTTDYASINHLYMTNGREGAQARNEIVSTARDVLYGVDPRVVVGGSNAAGTSQWYPGNNANTAPFTKHLPVYLMAYSDGKCHGQPYYSAASGSDPTLAGTQYTMHYTPEKPGTYTHLRAIFASGIADTFTATIAVNGSDKGIVTLASDGALGNQVATARLPANVAYNAADDVTIRFTCNVQNALIRCYMNGVFNGSLLTPGTSFHAYLTGDPNRVMPIAPIPYDRWPVMYSRVIVHAGPSAPAGLTATGGPGYVALSWTASPEAYTNGYEVFRDGVSIGTPSTTGFSDFTAVNDVSHSYTVKAVGLDGRRGVATGAQSATPTTPAVIAYQGARGTLTTGGATGATTQIVPVSNVVTAGNSLIVIAGGRNSSAVLSSVTDSKGNAYTISVQAQDSGSNNTVAIARGQIAVALTATDTVTLTWSAAVGPSRMAELHEFFGIRPTTAVDKTFTQGTGGTVTAVAIGPTAVTVQPTELIVGALVSGTASLSSTFTGTGGYTTLGALMKTSGATNGDRELAALYRAVTSTAAQTATGTLDVANSYVGAIATFKGA